MNLKTLLPVDVLNPESYPNTSSLDETNINKTGWKQKGYEEPEITFKNKLEFMQAKLMARKIANMNSSNKKRKKKNSKGKRKVR